MKNFLVQTHFRKGQGVLSYDLKIEGFDYFETSRFKIWGAGVVYRLSGSPPDSLGEVLEFLGRSFEKYQAQITAHLDGHYMFLIEDRHDKKLWILNNHYQVGNFHYAEIDGEFLVASRFKDIVEILRKNRGVRVHFPSVHNFLANGFNVSDETLVAGVKRSLAGFSICISRNGLQVHNGFSSQFKIDRKPFHDLEGQIDQYIETYRSSLRHYLDVRKPKELAILLSGGHDTSFLMANASAVWSRPVHAFSVVFPNWNFDEGPMAQRTCEKFKGQFWPIEFKPEHLDLTLDLIRACEEPVVGSSLPLFLLSKKASEVTDMIMGGDAGDTLWGEYYPVGEYHRWVKNWPSWIRSGAHLGAKALRKTFDSERLWELEHVSGLFTENDFYSSFLRKLCTYRHFNTEYQKKLFNSELSRALSFSVGTYEVPFRKKTFDDDLIEGKLFNGFFTYQSHHTYKGMESTGIDFFMPTIDRQVMSFINQLPARWINGGHTFQRLTNSKKINRLFHKKALARFFESSEIYNRSFDIPWHAIMRPRKQLLTQLLRRLKLRGWYDERFLDGLFAEFQSQKVKSSELLELRHHGYRIFSLLALELWCIEFIDGTQRATIEKGGDLEDYLSSAT